MEFGKLPQIDHIKFVLPPDPEENMAVLSALPAVAGQPALYIGCTGWAMKEWVGRIYPAKTPSRDYLLQYGRQFNTIELNSTHYTIPKATTVQQWYRQVPEDFRFCPKVLQAISHSKSLNYGSSLLTLWLDAVLYFEAKLGCCFIQLPPYFGMKELPALEQWLERLPAGFPMSVEMRSMDTFQSAENTDAWIQILKAFDISPVITDVAGRRDVLHMRLTNGKVVIRFVGNGLHPTDYQRINEWVVRLKSWFDAGLKEAYFFTHEPDNLLAPELAAYLADKAGQMMPHVILRGPSLPKQSEQLTLF